MTQIQKFKEWLCGCSRHVPPSGELVPDDVRIASHALNNAASILHGSVLRLRKEADVLAELTSQMRGTRDE